MQKHGVNDWGGLMRDRIEAIVGVECLVDAIHKAAPLVAMAARQVAAGAVADSGSALLEEAKKKVKDAEKETRNAEENLASVEEQSAPEATVDDAPPKPEQPAEALSGSQDSPEVSEGQGGPRDNAGVRGMKNENSSASPAETDGSEASAPATAEVPLTRSWFVDNFGMSSAAVSEMLIKAGRHDALEIIQPLIIEERKAIVKHFEGVSFEVVEEIPLGDSDYEYLSKNSERLRIPFLQLVKGWSDAEDDEQREKALTLWTSRIDKSTRLSIREDDILKRCAEVMWERGPMNAQTLKSYGVSAPSKEIAKLIRSHGFLYDIIKAGQGTKSDERSLFYDIDRPDVVIKNVGRLIGSLLDTGGELGIGPRGEPRLSLPFSSLNAPAYANAVKSEMGVRNVRAEGPWLIVEGEAAVGKALEWSIPSMNEKRDDAIIMKSAISGDEKAQKILAFNLATPYRQLELMKTWNWSIETFDTILKEVVANGE